MIIDRCSAYKKYLPSGFEFGQEFLEIITQDKLPDIDLWWFFCSSDNYIDYWCEEIKKLYPDRLLIPFANWRYSDDIVCFDGSDISGDPKVYYIHAFASPGWEERGSVANFNEWFKLAQEESARYKIERAEENE